MMQKSYTPAEASAVAKLPLRAVHKLIDGRMIRTQRSRLGNRIQRMLSAEHLIYLRLEADGVRLLPRASRREVARAIEAAPDVDSVIVAGGSALIVQVKSARQEVKRELTRLRKAQRMAVSDPEIMGGSPVFKGTRIPVDLVATMTAQGATAQEILDGYPGLNREQVELATLYVAAFPRRGRPAKRPWAKQKPTQVSVHPRLVTPETKG
jgi:uncharacterized protein (DUF433 family)